MIANPCPSLRSELKRCTAQYILISRMEEDFWRQKSAIRWVVEGEQNTKYYQGWVKQKRVKSRIHVIKDGDRELSNEVDIRDSAALFFQNLLSSDISVPMEHSLEGHGLAS